MQPYQKCHKELSVQDFCVLRGDRVVIPEEGRDKILEILHDGHPGITKMKLLARSVVWWPEIDLDIENKVKACEMCALYQKYPPIAPLHPWEWPKKSWTRLHIDYAGPFIGKMFLVIVDAYSKWLEVVPVSSANSTQTVAALRQVFSTHGIPEVIVSNNGTLFKYKFRVEDIYQEQRNSPLNICTIPPINQRSCRKGSPDFQERNEEKWIWRVKYQTSSFFIIIEQRLILQLARLLPNYSWDVPSEHVWIC